MQCVAAYKRAYQVATRAPVDTIPNVGLLVTTPAIVGETARECVAHLSIPKVEPRELVLLARSYAVAGDSRQSLEALDRALAVATTARERAEAIHAVLDEYISGMMYPVQKADITQLLKRADALTDPVGRIASAGMHASVAAAYLFIGMVPDERLFREVDSLVAAAPSMDFTLYPQAKPDIQNANALVTILRMFAGLQYPPIGTHAARLAGETIVGPPGGQYPAPGKVTLVISQMSASRGAIAAARRLKRMFGDTLDVVYLARTLGSFKLQAPLTWEQEKTILASYFENDLRVDGIVLAEPPSFRKRPEPDGRLVYLPSANDRTYGQGCIAIVGKDGIIRFFSGMWIPRLEALFEAMIRTLGAA
jgi:hypothetical protein